MANRPPLVLTKPAGQQPRWKSALEATGWTVWSLPLLALTPLPDNSEHRAVWQNLDAVQGVIMVSPLAAQLTARAVERWWRQPPLGIHWLASGSTSAEALESGIGGISVATPPNGNTAEDVLQSLGKLDVTDRHWLIIAGEGGRDTLQSGLARRGARVTRLALYRRAPLPVDVENRIALAEQSTVIQVSSTTVLEHLTSQVDPITKQRATLLVSSMRVDAAAAVSWPNRIVARGASLSATLEALQPIAQTD